MKEIIEFLIWVENTWLDLVVEFRNPRNLTSGSSPARPPSIPSPVLQVPPERWGVPPGVWRAPCGLGAPGERPEKLPEEKDISFV